MLHLVLGFQHSWSGLPPTAARLGWKHTVEETLGDVGNPARRRQPLQPVRRMVVCYNIKCLHNAYFTPTLGEEGWGGPGHL